MSVSSLLKGISWSQLVSNSVGPSLQTHRLARRALNQLSYQDRIDDLVLVAETEEFLMEKLHKWKRGMELRGLRGNKTKVSSENRPG